MQLRVGAVTEGRVTGITKFGAFVAIEKGVVGLVHISEISKSFVTDISNVLKCGDVVRVKILNFSDNKLSLSIKQVEDSQQTKPLNSTPQKNKTFTLKNESSFKKQQSPPSFEEMLAKFKKVSEEKISDIRKNLEGKRSSYSRKK